MAVVALVLTGFIGFAHTPAGQGLLARLPGMGLCPLDVGELSAEERDRVRRDRLASVRGNHAAASKSVLGFVLGRSSRADIQGWAHEHGVPCEPEAQSRELQCSNVPADALEGAPAAGTIRFGFDARRRLVSVATTHQSAEVEPLVRALHQRVELLQAGAGRPASIRGIDDPAYLRSGLLNQHAVEFRFTDRRSALSVTNLGKGRFVMREIHQVIEPART